MSILKDSDLSTPEQIQTRLASIRRERETLCDTPCKSNGISAFRAKSAKIAKLTDREGRLEDRLFRMRKEAVHEQGSPTEGRSA